jgi:hypothetical protein
LSHCVDHLRIGRLANGHKHWPRTPVHWVTKRPRAIESRDRAGLWGGATKGCPEAKGDRCALSWAEESSHVADVARRAWHGLSGTLLAVVPRSTSEALRLAVQSLKRAVHTQGTSLLSCTVRDRPRQAVGWHDGTHRA